MASIKNTIICMPRENEPYRIDFLHRLEKRSLAGYDFLRCPEKRGHSERDFLRLSEKRGFVKRDFLRNILAEARVNLEI